MPETEDKLRLSLMAYPFPEIKRVEEVFSTLKAAICAMLLDEIADDVLPEPKK